MPPIVITTWSFSARAISGVWPALVAGGRSLDAVEGICRFVEDDVAVDSVGFGGLPDRDGNMTLDGCVMLDPARCGSVCAMRRHRHPVTIARHVMERTPHVMLAGPDADDFAYACGEPAESLLAPEAAERYAAWRRAPRAVDQSRDGADGNAPRAAARPIDAGTGGRLFATDDTVGHDTVCALALDDQGVLAGACSTSGTPYKVPGRVGDSPIIGHGLYVDPAAGAASATGTGELMMGVCASFLAVERMRSGEDPDRALRTVLERIADSYTLQPTDQVALIALTPDGRTAAAALRSGFKAVVTTGDEPAVLDPSFVLLADPTE